MDVNFKEFKLSTPLHALKIHFWWIFALNPKTKWS